MPSMLTLVAFDVRQFSTTDLPRSIADGSAVIDAVGGGIVFSGAIAEGGGAACFLWQPEAVSRASVATMAALFQNVVRLDIRSSSCVACCSDALDKRYGIATIIVS